MDEDGLFSDKRQKMEKNNNCSGICSNNVNPSKGEIRTILKEPDGSGEDSNFRSTLVHTPNSEQSILKLNTKTMTEAEREKWKEEPTLFRTVSDGFLCLF